MPKQSILILILIVSLTVVACGGSEDNGADTISATAGGPPPQTDVAPLRSESETQPQAIATPLAEAVETLDPIVTFAISGGIAGFCDTLSVTADGNYILAICNQPTMLGKLPEGDLTSLQNWLKLVKSFEVIHTDNAGGADTLTARLNFMGHGEIEADEIQRQLLYDWANGLVVRLRPTPQPENVPVGEPVALNPTGLCPEIQRPALILSVADNPGVAVLMDANTQATCDVIFRQPPFGRLMSADGNLYYPILDSETNSVTVWQIKPNGEQQPLEFTTIVMDAPGPYTYLVSDDGSKIAWTQTLIDDTVDPPQFTNYLWLADIDGANKVTLLDDVKNSELRYTSLVRFGTDNALYYALQPDIGGPVFSGRYDTLYSVPAGGSEAELLYACAAEENAVCIGGLSMDGKIITVIQPETASIQVINRTDDVLATIPLPATDYVERTAFAPDGSIAFFSATLTEPADEEETPRPEPGYITLLTVPYTGQPETLLSSSNVATLLGWLDNERLVYGILTQEGDAGTGLLSRTGQMTEISADFGLGVLR